MNPSRTKRQHLFFFYLTCSALSKKAFGVDEKLPGFLQKYTEFFGNFFGEIDPKIEVNSPANRTTKLGEVIEYHGDVRIRRANSYNFFPLKEGELLYNKDRIFTGAGSTALIRYSFQKESLISVPQFAIYEISAELPTSRILSKGYTRGSNDISSMLRDKKKVNAEKKELFFGGTQEIEPTQDEDDSSGFASQQEFGLRLVYRMTEVFLDFPKRDVFLFLKGSAPYLLKAKLKDPASQLYMGNLWEENKLTSPVYSHAISAGEKYFPIRIDKAGDYVFQAFSQDSTSKTRSFRIHAIKFGSRSFPNLPNQLLPGDAIIMP